MTMNVLSIGTIVRLINDISGLITSIQISGNPDDITPSILYQISWWHNGVRYEEWFRRFEFTILDLQQKETQIGFK